MSPIPPDPYKILGVSKDAQTAAIRSAHRKLVLQCHPDKIQDPKLKAEKQDEFQRVQQAYELLIDDSERQKYDEKVKMESLRKNVQTKVRVSSPRATSRFAGEFEIRTPETRSSPFKSSTPPAGPKVYTTYTRGSTYDDDYARGPRIFEAHIRPSARREASYADKPTKRESERERERERERDREKDRERERRRKDDDRRAAKADKDALKAEKKKREKQRDKEIKRETEEKQQQRYAKPHVEDFDEEEPRPPRTRSASKKVDEKRERERERERERDRDRDRDRGSPRDPIGRFFSPIERATYTRASSYMNASGIKHPGLQRSASYSVRTTQPPMAPTPPPPVNKKSIFVGPDETDSDENVRRSAARSRRGSGDSSRMPRERAYRQSSRDVLEDPIPATSSPAAHQTPRFTKSASNTPVMSGSPPRWELPRTNTMPVQPSVSRPGPGITRSQTFNSFGESFPRGRGRSRMQAQVEESDSDEYERRTRDKKYRSARRTHSPEPMKHNESISRYAYEGNGRTRRKESYDADSYAYMQNPYGGRVSESRFPGGYRESSYAPPPTHRYPSVKTSKMYSPDDVRYSDYNNGMYRSEYAVRA